MKKIKDISIQEIKTGKNWKLVEPSKIDGPMEEWEIEDTEEFKPLDSVVYSAIGIDEANKAVTALIVIKVVEEYDYWGDSCEYKDGKWQQAGLVPNPSAPNTEGFIANPLNEDNSFYADWDYRGHHRENFRKWVDYLN